MITYNLILNQMTFLLVPLPSNSAWQAIHIPWLGHWGGVKADCVRIDFSVGPLFCTIQTFRPNLFTVCSWLCVQPHLKCTGGTALHRRRSLLFIGAVFCFSGWPSSSILQSFLWGSHYIPASEKSSPYLCCLLLLYWRLIRLLSSGKLLLLFWLS